MVKCFFCGQEENAHKGVHLLKNDGSINYFCSSKCRKNALKLRRDKRKVRWSEFFHISRERAKKSHDIKVAEEKAEKIEEKERKKESKKAKKITEKPMKKDAKKSTKKGVKKEKEQKKSE